MTEKAPNGRRKLIGPATIVLMAGAVAGCLFEGDEEVCGSIQGLPSVATADGCIDPGDTRCVGAQPDSRAEVRVDSYDIRLTSGAWVRSEGADFGHRPPLVTLALTSGSDDETATATDLSVGQTLEAAGRTYRVASICDTGVTWLLPAGAPG